MFCLCDRVDDMPFEGNQEQQFEEEHDNSLYFIAELHKFDGTPIKDFTESFTPKP